MPLTPNPDRKDAPGEVGKAPIQRFAADVGRISESHRGRPQPEILVALLSAARDAGLEPNESDLASLAEHLSEAPGNTSY